jgi:hypothetical protein
LVWISRIVTSLSSSSNWIIICILSSLDIKLLVYLVEWAFIPKQSDSIYHVLQITAADLHYTDDTNIICVHHNPNSVKEKNWGNTPENKQMVSSKFIDIKS